MPDRLGHPSTQHPSPLTLLALALATATLGWGQLGRGSISGTVTDQQGAIVPGVSVTILNAGTNATFKSSTNDQGLYTAPGLVVGDYQVTAEAAGFKRAVRSGLNLQVDQRARWTSSSKWARWSSR